MDEAPLDRLNAMTMVFDAMSNMGVEVTIEQFDEFELEIHTAVVRLKKAGMWMRQIIPLVTSSVRILERMSYVAKGCEAQGTSTQDHGMRVLSKKSAALLAMVEAYTSGDSVLFSDEMLNMQKNEDSSSSHNHNHGP